MVDRFTYGTNFDVLHESFERRGLNGLRLPFLPSFTFARVTKNSTLNKSALLEMLFFGVNDVMDGARHFITHC